MDKLRLKLLIGLILIFAVTGIAFLMTILGGGASLTGAAVADPEPVSLGMALPGILFVGFLILSIVYLEKKY